MTLGGRRTTVKRVPAGSRASGGFANARPGQAATHEDVPQCPLQLGVGEREARCLEAARKGSLAEEQQLTAHFTENEA